MLRALGPLVALAVVALPALGCSSTPEARDARAGHMKGLAERVTASVDRGVLTRGDAQDLARAVIRGELERASGDYGIRRVRSLAACARSVKGDLSSRADEDDDVGAEAALLLMDQKISSFSGDLDAKEARWRAVAARGLTGNAGKRRAHIVDGDQEVRLNALRAATKAADSGDLDVVLEAARLDPYPAARIEAARAAGAIGGERAVLALKDLWPQADEPMRRAIVQAWGDDASIRDGGRRELVWAMDAARGGAGIVAAHLLVLAGDEGSAAAAGVLERAIEAGPTQDRILAMMLSPADHAEGAPLRAAMVKAEGDADDAVAIAAISRHLADGAAAADRAALVAKLTKYAAGSSRWSSHAKFALARAGDAAVHALLLKDLKSKDAWQRIDAAIALAAFGDLRHAAIGAVDPSSDDARIRVACAILGG